MALIYLCLITLMVRTTSSTSGVLSTTDREAAKPLLDYKMKGTDIHYYLTLWFTSPRGTKEHFAEEAKIYFVLKKPTTKVILQPLTKKFSSKDIYELTEESPRLRSVHTYPPLYFEDHWDLSVKNGTLKVGWHSLRVHFDGLFNTKAMKGLYRGYYQDGTDEEDWFVVTNFEPNYAGSSFPVLGTRQERVDLLIKNIHPSGYNVIGNAMQTRNPRDIFSTLEYYNVPLHTVAFVVSKFTCSEREVVKDMKFSVCTRPKVEGMRKLALSYGPKLLQALLDFTNYSSIYNVENYRLQGTGVFQVGIPKVKTESKGNWGLIISSEDDLLFDENESSALQKQRVIKRAAYAMSNFWFENLISVKKWEDIYVTKGLSTFFEYFISDQVEPSLELDKQFVLDHLQPALAFDSFPRSSIISDTIKSKEDLNLRYDWFTYSKAGSLVRMLYRLVPDDFFRHHLYKFLETWKFQNFNSDDFWNQFTDKPDDQFIHLPAVFKSFANKSGCPIVIVNHQQNGIKFEIIKFNVDDYTSPVEQWRITPISYTTSSVRDFQNTSEKFSIREGTTPIQMFEDTEIGTDDWIIVNIQVTGYYRVSYDVTLLDRIEKALHKLQFDGIPEINRAQILDDYFHFTMYGSRSYSEFLNLTKFLKNDISYYTWHTAFKAFSFFFDRIEDAKMANRLRAYIFNLTELVYNSVSFNEDSGQHMKSLKRAMVLSNVCKLGLQHCVINAIEAFIEYRKTGIKPDKDLRYTIYCNALRHSSHLKNDWDFLWKEFEKEELQEERNTILAALACAKDEEILKDYLNKSIKENSGIILMDPYDVFFHVCDSNPGGLEIALEFFLKNYKKIYQYYNIGSVTQKLLRRLRTLEQVQKLRICVASVGYVEYYPIEDMIVAEDIVKDIKRYFNILSIRDIPTS